MRKNILLFVLVLTISFASASYVGGWYDKISPQYGSLFLGNGKNAAVSFAGFLVSYVFFIPFIYSLFGFKKNKNWIIWLLLPVILLWFYADKYYFYIPVLLIIVAFLIAKLIQFIIFKLKRPNPPIIQG